MHWLMKSEPSVYSIDDLAREGSACWEGVRNYSARNNMRRMSLGDLVLFYHSNTTPPGVAGVARVCREAYPDHYQWDEGSRYFDAKVPRDRPRWFMVDVEFVDKFTHVVPLGVLRETPGLENMVVTKRSRLSVQPVTREEFDIVLRLGQSPRH